ncbi:hypothetical protein CTAYLR_005805 [Chrysophaeum taylorii]|uniref:Uncharacterized protein n=1 Tax=Chrysophaeum taylorii TaxID=2483200 RepID=A0AAD7XTF3_9STRA|nr:hypothetical protein CTAYLR_005805 [Chrysophaeum taylorii]
MTVLESVTRFLSGRRSGTRRNEIRRVERFSSSASFDADPNTGCIIEKRIVEPLTKCDVLVVGGGPAGLCAALGAKRASRELDVVILERFGCYGGVITHVGMETVGWYRYAGTDDTEGIGREMERLAQNLGASQQWPYNDSHCLDTERFKCIADDLLTKEKVRCYLHCLVVDAILVDGKIAGVVTESKSGRKAVLAKRVVDCTGDADVAHRAGCEYSTVSPDRALGVSLVLNACGVNVPKFKQFTESNCKTYDDWNATPGWEQETSGKENGLKTPYLDLGGDIGGSWSGLSTDTGEATNLNLVHLKGYDATNVEHLTKAEMEGRAGALEAITRLRDTVPGFEKARLRNLAMTLGVRDTRKIKGIYDLTAHDVTRQARFDDAIGVFPEFVDGYNVLLLPTTGRAFELPYRALVPPKINNLIVAGRCVSGDSVSHAATRNMMCCCVTGQAAGVAAATSLRLGLHTHDLKGPLVQAIQAALQDQGAKVKAGERR